MPDMETPSPGAPRRLRHRGLLGMAAAGLLAAGGVAGAVAIHESRPTVSMASASPVPIASLSSGGTVTVRGRVAEIYGNKLVVADASGRALVDTGPEGDRNAIVALGAPVTVQGRYDRGFIHAAFLSGPDGKVQALGPLAGPPHPPAGRPGGPGAPPPGAAVPPPPPPPPSPSVTATASPAPAEAPQAPAPVAIPAAQ